MENQTSEETQVDETTEPVEEAETQEEVDEETSEETVEKETPDDESKTPAVDYEAKFKASQAEAIKLKKLNDELKRAKPKSASEPLDVDSILEVQTATKGLDSDEVEELRLRAKAMESSLTEARKDENFVLWRDARREKVAKQKALNPSTTQSEKEKPKTIEDRLKSAKSFEEKEKILDEIGLNPMNTNYLEDNFEG